MRKAALKAAFHFFQLQQERPPRNVFMVQRGLLCTISPPPV